MNNNRLNNAVPEVNIKQVAIDTYEEVISIRRHFHQHPELSWREEKTLSYIEEYADKHDLLKSLSFHKGRGGIWFDLKPHENKHFIIFRADIDALNIQESNDVQYKSKVSGVMHACGHDCHAAMLLVAMREIVGLYEKYPVLARNNIRFVFQRAEEAGNGGDVIVNQDSVCHNAEAAVAIHIDSSKASGELGSRPGTIFAHSSTANLVVNTTGGHGGSVHRSRNALDYIDDLVPIIRGFAQKFQNGKEGLITVSRINSKTETNASVPTMASSTWSINAGSERQLELIKKEFEDLCKRHLDGRVKSYSFSYYIGGLPVVNDEELTRKVYAALDGNVHMNNAIYNMCEDFYYYGKKIPATLWLLGTGSIPGVSDNSHHQSNFDVDESSLWEGVYFWISVAVNY